MDLLVSLFSMLCTFLCTAREPSFIFIKDDGIALTSCYNVTLAPPLGRIVWYLAQCIVAYNIPKVAIQFSIEELWPVQCIRPLLQRFGKQLQFSLGSSYYGSKVKSEECVPTEAKNVLTKKSETVERSTFKHFNNTNDLCKNKRLLALLCSVRAAAVVTLVKVSWQGSEFSGWMLHLGFTSCCLYAILRKWNISAATHLTKGNWQWFS